MDDKDGKEWKRSVQIQSERTGHDGQNQKNFQEAHTAQGSLYCDTTKFNAKNVAMKGMCFDCVKSMSKN
jgi:hypothetical protein